MQIETIPIAQLNPVAWNPRIDLQPSMPEYEKLRKSIEHFDLVEPLVWNKRTGNLVGGHQRLKIMKQRGDTHAEVSVVDLDEKEEARLNLALNKISGDWDMPKLKDLLVELDDGDFDMEIAGFDDKELEEIMTATAPEIQEDDFDGEAAAEAITEPVTKRGDIIELGRHRVMCGDATSEEDVGRLTNGVRVPAILTDPPYQMGKDIAGDSLGDDDFLRLHCDAFQAAPVAEKFSALCFHGTRAFPVALKAAEASGWKFERMLWFSKPNDCTYPWRGWILKSEAILVFSGAGGSWCDVHPYHHDTYEFNRQRPEFETKDKPLIPGTWHPTVKPLIVVGDLLNRLGGDTVYDPFLGSGTTLIAAEQLGRVCYGMEIEPRYCDVIVQRWEKFTGKKAVRPMPTEQLVAANA